MDTSAWLTAIACLTLVVSVPILIVTARSMVRAIRRLRHSPDDRDAEVEYGYMGTFTLMLGLASCMSLGVVLVSQQARWPGLAIAGAALVNLLVQPIALLFCWVGFRKVTLGMFGQVAVAWRRVPESELAHLTRSERRVLAWQCVASGVIMLCFGAWFSVSCAWLLVQAATA